MHEDSSSSRGGHTLRSDSGNVDHSEMAALRDSGHRAPSDVRVGILPRASRQIILLTTILFLLIAGVLSWRVSGGISYPDESSYHHQARIFGAGQLFAVSPPTMPGIRIRFEHEIVSDKGWYSKYPVGWPLVLAIPEKLGMGWLVAPVLGALTLLLLGKIAYELFNSWDIAALAVTMTALSPYFLSNNIGRMSHALAGVLIAAAALFCLQGMRTGRVIQFVWMFALLIVVFHVRPFTALIAAIVLGLSALLSAYSDRRVVALSVVAGLVSVASVLAYNYVFTGDPLVSPYALVRGRMTPVEIGATFSVIREMLLTTWRFSVQSTLLFSFPFVFLLAAYGLFTSQTKRAYVLAALFLLIVVAHLVQTEPSVSVVGERYWSEAYFGVTVLAAAGILRLLEHYKVEPTTKRAMAFVLLAVQVVMTAASAVRLDAMVIPTREVRKLAETYRECDCVVFLKETDPFFSKHLNLNGADWRTTKAFYAEDPGPQLRQSLAGRLGKQQWIVLGYDPVLSTASVREPMEAIGEPKSF